jgi:hypothetical protein
LVTKALNDTPNQGIGLLRPSDITDPIDDPKVHEALEGSDRPLEPTLKQRKEHQQKYEADSSKLQVNSYVYADTKETPFKKSYDTKVTYLDLIPQPTKAHFLFSKQRQCRHMAQQ